MAAPREVQRVRREIAGQPAGMPQCWVHPEPKYGAACLYPPTAGRVEERTSIAVQLGADLHPLAVLYLGEEGFVRTLMLGRAEAHSRGTEDIVVVLDAL